MEHQIIFLMIWTLAAIEGLPGTTTGAVNCRKGWSYFNGSCYLFVNSEKDTWIEAVTHCNVLRGYLADILDESENIFVKSELRKTNVSGCFFTSATDVEAEGRWVWTNTDDLVEFFYWAPGEPQNSGAGENCMCLSSYLDFHWADVSCHSLRHFICKKRVDTGIGLIG